MGQSQLLAEQFEAHRPHLKAVAYRMLGSLSEAEDVVQETWLRYSRTETASVINLGGWLTTVIGRICLDMLRARKIRDHDSLATTMPDPIVDIEGQVDPEHEAVLADQVGLALQVVLDALEPAERLAYVLHDMFAVPFDDIAAVVNRSPAATRKLASRARQRVDGAQTAPDGDLARQRKAVDAFFTASREGDFEALVAVLDPDIVIRGDGGAERPGLTMLLRGAKTVAEQALTFRRLAPFVHPVLVNGVAGVLVAPAGRPYSIMAFTVRNDRIVAVNALSDPQRLRQLDLPDFT